MDNPNKKKLFVLVMVLALIIVIVLGAWYFMKKSPRNIGSTCSSNLMCKSGICVNQKCTEGQKDDVCRSYTDCDKGLSCKANICSEIPDSSVYFNKVVISKMNPLLPVSPDNQVTEAAAFKTTEGVEVAFVGVKAEAKGAYYIELARSDNREIALTTRHLPETKLEGKDTNTAVNISRIEPAEYDLNVYLNSELIYTTPITIDQ